MKSGLNEMFYDGRSDEAKVERPFSIILNTFIELVLKIDDEPLLTVICQMMEYLNNSLSEDYLSGPGDSGDIPA